jgi:hypothetical protein
MVVVDKVETDQLEINTSEEEEEVHVHHTEVKAVTLRKNGN